MKISDFGLSRTLAKDNTYYHLTETKKLPVKWMALESLLYKKFSTYSDGELHGMEYRRMGFVVLKLCHVFSIPSLELWRGAVGNFLLWQNSVPSEFFFPLFN